MSELFKRYNNETETYEVIDPKEFWEILTRYGFYPHPAIMQSYLDADCCIYCGGEIIKVEGITPDRWEKRCGKCNYLYEEK